MVGMVTLPVRSCVLIGYYTLLRQSNLVRTGTDRTPFSHTLLRSNILLIDNKLEIINEEQTDFEQAHMLCHT